MDMREAERLKQYQSGRTIETVDGVRYHVERGDDARFWVVECCGERFGIKPLSMFTEERAQAAARMRREAMAATLSTAVRLLMCAARGATHALRTTVLRHRVAHG